MKYIEDIRHPWDFDSSIDPPYFAEEPTSFEFAIILRVYLEPVNPPDGKSTFMAPDYDGRLWPALRWNNASWIDFQARYSKLVLQVWDKAFILIPPAKYDGFVWPDGGKRRNLLCRLRLKVQDVRDHPHAAIRVVRLAAPDKSHFRSDSGMYTSVDVMPKRRRFEPEGASFLGNTPAHEVGHLLGLWHSGLGDARCAERPESSVCYGSNLTDRMNVMGAGGMLDLSNALPWLSRIPLHVPSTKRPDWKADWASSEAALRGLESLQVDETHKKPYQPPKPGIIDL